MRTMPLRILGTGRGPDYIVGVAYYTEFPRNRRGVCAFCDGDPLGEYSPPNARINRFAQTFLKEWGHPMETCPVCEGRPS